MGSRDAALRSGRQKAVLAELTAEMDNLRAAWEWAVTDGDVARIHRVSSTLWYLYQHHGWFAEGEAVFRRAADVLEGRASSAGAAVAGRTTVYALLAHSAFFASSRGRVAEAYGDLASVVSALRESADAGTLAYCHWYMGIAAWGSGRYGEAIDGFEESLKRGREAGEPYYEAAAGTFLGVVQHELGDYEEAQERFAQATLVARPLGDIMLLSHLLGYASLTALARGENAEAAKMLHEGLALAREIGCRTSEALAMDGLGQAAVAIGDRREAEPFFAAAADIYREIRSSWNLSRVQHRRGQNLLALGHIADARTALIESSAIAAENGLVSAQLETLALLADIETLQPEATDAGG